jgi:predicted O-methyltransferase YrrM
VLCCHDDSDFAGRDREGRNKVIRQIAKRAAMLAPSIRRIVEQRDAALGRVAELQLCLNHAGANESVPSLAALGVKQYAMQPGTEYARYAIPLDYLPSRDLRPRWGTTLPPIAPIAAWVAEHDEDYRQILRAMADRANLLAKIPLQFDHRTLEPAWFGVPFAPFDSAALYTLVGETKPRLYLEIGSGVTTAFAKRSIQDHGLSTRIISIDPEPRAAIDAICDEVIRQGLETCDVSLFDALEPGDILFMDGSHRAFMNSDVTVFMIDVLPRLKPGVLIHVHDITLPWDYPDMFINWYWSEAYILAAYLIGARDRVIPIFPTAWVCRAPQFGRWFERPIIDLGGASDSWRGGGSMWFTHAP